ncbi:MULTISPECIES: hypothetical protein [unclassified Bacillus (in: firmicutes)]|uniref:hypothetical protein n=1 Tax=unclassified Bacillus (in: firmicutes) TaxID=185979 RepID=UPI001EEC2269|nr:MULTISPECIES: hypothetical protein [unclassified Bacillus (in: firmicutes)]
MVTMDNEEITVLALYSDKPGCGIAICLMKKSSETKGGGNQDIFILLKAYVKVSVVSGLPKKDGTLILIRAKKTDGEYPASGNAKTVRLFTIIIKFLKERSAAR